MKGMQLVGRHPLWPPLDQLVCANLTQAGVIWKEGTLLEKMAYIRVACGGHFSG